MNYAVYLKKVGIKVIFNNKQNQKCFQNSRSVLKVMLIILVLCGFLIGDFQKPVVATANTGSIVNVTIDYTTELATVKPGGGSSTKFYMSKDNMRTWELLDTQYSSGNELYAVVDISSNLKPKESLIYFKGNRDQGLKEVSLQPLDSSLQVFYQISGGVGRATWDASKPVEYRVGVNGQWQDVQGSVITLPYEIYGATLNFRTKASQISRSGKIVSLRVPKKPTAPSVKIDGSKLCISGLKNGETQYRINDEIIWRKFESSDSKVKYLDLKTLFAPSQPDNVSIPSGTIEIRTAATDKKVASAAKVIEIPAQPGVTNIAQLIDTTLTILDTDVKRQYEYTVIPVNTKVDYQIARWTSITASRPVIIKKATIGDQVLVRIKSTTDKVTKQIVPASTYQKFDVTGITVVIK